MYIKTIIAGAAIVLAATFGLAYADDEFSTLEGVTAVAMSSGELDAVAGLHIHFQVITPGKGLINPDTPGAADPLRGPMFRVNNQNNNLNGPDGSGDGNGPGYNGLGDCPGIISVPGTC